MLLDPWTCPNERNRPNGRMDRQTNGRTDGRTDGRMGRRTDRRADDRTGGQEVWMPTPLLQMVEKIILWMKLAFRE